MDTTDKKLYQMPQTVLIQCSCENPLAGSGIPADGQGGQGGGLGAKRYQGDFDEESSFWGYKPWSSDDDNPWNQ